MVVDARVMLAAEHDVLNAPTEVTLVPDGRELEKPGEPWSKARC
jgi:hypothetical protein